MLANLVENLSASPERTFFLVITAAFLALSVHRMFREHRIYGTLEYVGAVTKGTAVVTSLLLVWQLFLGSQPYTPPPSRELAIVLGNTKNTPRPTLGSDVSEMLEESLLLHKGESVEEFLSSFAFVSATAPPHLLTVDSGAARFVPMSVNKTRAKRDARDNLRALRDFLGSTTPRANGASYLEAIIEASRNVGVGSTITVFGSGLSDSGDLDFAHGDLLTSGKKRVAAIEGLTEKYGPDYLAGYTVYFVGLGDTVKPQVPLSAKQKDIVRGLYEDAVRALGGRVRVSTKTQTGRSIKTDFTVSTTDTGCGNVDYTLDGGTLEFVSDQAVFVDPAKARRALRRVLQAYEADPDRVERIDVRGYIYLTSEERKRPGASAHPLSQQRADAVRDLLVDQGVAADAIRAVGKGAGPHNDPKNPGLDRKVEITINRSPNPDC